MGVQEAIPSREFASAFFGSGKPLALIEVEQHEIGQMGRRISIPAKAMVFTEGEPTVAVYKLTQGTAVLYKMIRWAQANRPLRLAR